MYAAVRAGTPLAGALIDPVCRMALDPARAAARVVHGGVTYHFCSPECVARFAAAPEVYAGALSRAGAPCPAAALS